MDRRKICRYFERGSCKKQNCPFVHLKENRKTCQFFVQGFCKKGAKCNFYHPPKENDHQKTKRDNFKPSLNKKQINHENQQQQDRFPIPHEKTEETTHHEAQQGPSKQEEAHPTHTRDLLTEEYKRKQIDFLIGIGQDFSSDQEIGEEVMQITEQPKRKPLNFTKIYGKKFPDYTKSTESKQKIMQNQKLYFKGIKFLDLISKAQTEVEKQWYQIIRKFQDSFSEIEPTEGSRGKYFSINLRPLLYEAEIPLHFEMVEDYIQIRIDGRNYPAERAKFQIANISIPEEYKTKLVAYLDKVHASKSIYDTLKVLVNNFQKIYEEIKSKLENEYYSQIELEQKIDKRIQEQKERKEKKKERKQKKVKNEQKNTKAQNPDLQPIKFSQNQKINVSNMNYQIKLDSLLITNAEYVLAERFLLYIECQCEKQLVHILEADRKELKIGIKLKCRKCQVHIPIAIQREVMQLRSQMIGRLGIQNGRLIEVGGISWKIGCTCDAEIIKPRICLPGSRLSANCHQCFRQMQVSYMGLGFFNPFFKQSEIIENEKQLPNRGACKHMKLSFRWIRYGCCGRKFSCDECHLNESVYPHEKIEGTTMLCGFCSYQQLVGRECMHCKRELVRGVDKSGHWEGGLGCRDKALLSKKDAKKYAGLTKQNREHKS